MDGFSFPFRLLSFVGNGHIATVVYSNVTYMSGVYNGENGLYVVFVSFFDTRYYSHRACIPSTMNWQTLFASQEYTELLLAYVVLIQKAPIGSIF